MSNNYILLDRIELNADAASVTFDNIPQSGYTDLKVVVSARTSRSGNPEDEVFIRFNGTTTGYSSRSLFGTGAATSSNTGGTAQINRTWTTANGATSNTFGSMDIYIPNYRGSQNKSVSVDAVSENNATTAYAVLTAGLWSNSAAITSITLLPEVGPNFLAGSTFSLYGLAQVGTTPAIAPKADGGNVIATDGTYWYHAFLSNGTFTPQVGLNADVLVVAGGGGGGSQRGCRGNGGGGAGGYRLTTDSYVSGTGYAVTIGAGGAAGTTTGANGNNSIVNSITSTGGGGGGAGSNNGLNGGSGGGGVNFGTGGTASPAGQGNTGGAGALGGGGGGGASAVGVAGDVTASGSGGNGGAGSNSASSWATATGTGVSGFYAGGGGGGSGNGSGSSGLIPGVGGAGGGGTARYAASGQGDNGTTNTGGGGAGGTEYSGCTSGNGGAGGSGIVIIRYLVA
jgi:hypothetical protein